MIVGGSAQWRDQLMMPSALPRDTQRRHTFLSLAFRGACSDWELREPEGVFYPFFSLEVLSSICF